MSCSLRRTLTMVCAAGVVGGTPMWRLGSLRAELVQVLARRARSQCPHCVGPGDDIARVHTVLSTKYLLADAWRAIAARVRPGAVVGRYRTRHVAANEDRMCAEACKSLGPARSVAGGHCESGMVRASK